ncbi:hypothetical protein GGU11DRAFT_749411 [Lentinula aff. detonsa]|nr:hypothetical protein GGU11DRAFT_749411 [Lentinula aff. detonsa]
MSNSTAPRICSTKKCNTVLPPEHIDSAKTCAKCRQKDSERKQRKRAIEKQQRDELEHPPSRPAPVRLNSPGPIRDIDSLNGGSDDEGNKNSPVQYKSGEDMFQALRKVSQKNHISFHGQYTMPTDFAFRSRARQNDCK